MSPYLLLGVVHSTAAFRRFIFSMLEESIGIQLLPCAVFHLMSSLSATSPLRSPITGRSTPSAASKREAMARCKVTKQIARLAPFSLPRYPNSYFIVTISSRFIESYPIHASARKLDCSPAISITPFKLSSLSPNTRTPGWTIHALEASLLL